MTADHAHALISYGSHSFHLQILEKLHRKIAKQVECGWKEQGCLGHTFGATVAISKR